MGTVRRVAAGLIFLTVFPACRSSEPSARQLPRVEKVADQKMEKLHLQSYGDTGLEWELSAPVAEGFSDDGSTIVKNLTVDLYENANKSTTVTADEGVMFSGSQKASTLTLSTFSVTMNLGDMFLSGNVVMISTDGSKLLTDWAHYKKGTNLIVSSAPVTVIREDSVTKGFGMEATPDLAHVKIFKQTLVIPDKPKEKK